MYTLLKLDPTLNLIYELTYESLSTLLKLPQKNLSIFLHDLHTTTIEKILEQYQNQNIRIITIIDQEYPSLLKEIYDPPFVLYASGNINLLQNSKKLSVVGSRMPTKYGINCIKAVLSTVIKEDWVIVSGLARGIDTEAHKYSMSINGKTIAVLGGGFSYIYPAENMALAKEMKETQLLISEYPNHIKPEKWHFPIRNRIISGLSQGTLIIEAKERSGTLITANLALQQGREVFAIPGSIFEKNFQGTNKLIQQGAKLVLNSEDILSELNNIS